MRAPILRLTLALLVGLAFTAASPALAETPAAPPELQAQLDLETPLDLARVMSSYEECSEFFGITVLADQGPQCPSLCAAQGGTYVDTIYSRMHAVCLCCAD